MNQELALSKFCIQVRRYINATMYRLPNREVMAGKSEGGSYFIVTKTVCTDPEPPVKHEHLRGKVHKVSTAYSQEAAEAIMLGLAKELGYVVCFDERNHNNEEKNGSMKTKAQILKDSGVDIRLADHDLLRSVSEAMQTYADQQCSEKDKAIAALREEILSVHESAEKWRSQRDNLLLESRDLRRRLDDCERKRIQGQRL